MKTIQLPDGEIVPALGQGTWRMGEDNSARAQEAAALRQGIDLGMTLIDTAEMYGEGGAEEIVADAIEGQHDRVFIVTKVYPHNASRAKLPRACERSLGRLRIDVIDLYLLHWPGDVPISETVDTFEQLRSEGKIQRWGVSNFDTEEMEELIALPSGAACAANQVLYNLENRDIEFDLLPWSRAHGIPMMAYAPVGHGRRLLDHEVLHTIAERHQATPAQIAIAWLLRQRDVIVIPKAANQRHVRENSRSLDIELTKDDLAEIDRTFPAPNKKQPLPTL